MTQSELSAYLTNEKKLITIGENSTSESLVSYPWAWADPTFLSKTNAYQVTRRKNLPTTLEELVRSSANQKYRVYANDIKKHIVFTRNKHIYIYDFKEEPVLIHLTVPNPIQFFCLLDETTGVAANSTGDVYYWKDITYDQPIHYTVSLLSNKEHITEIKSIDKNQVVLGSSFGEIYLLTIQDDKIMVSTLYKPTGVVSYITGIFQTPLPHVSQVEMPAYTESVLKINFTGDMIYIFSKKTLSIWKRHSITEFEVVSHLDLSLKIISILVQRVPSDVLKENIKFEIIDFCLIADRECVILVSYSTPGENVQYALVSFVLQSCYKKLQTSYSTFITATPHHGLPSLAATKSLAFVTFDNTVIAVSLDKKSIFEERVHLKNGIVLCTSLQGNNEDNKYNTAIIYTLENGIIEFQVNINEIQAQRDDGNIYAQVVPSVMDRDTLIFMSKLEQAVFFGASKFSPLIFSLVSEHVDVAHAVKSFSDKIMNMKCKLLPSPENITLFMEARYVFEKRIMTVLNENNIMDTIPHNIRSELFKRVESYLLALLLWQFYLERICNNVAEEYWQRILSDVLEPKDTDMIQDLLINQPFKILDFVSKMRSKVSIQGKKVKNAQEHMILFYTTNEVLMRLTQETYTFEKKHRKDYNVTINFDDPISAQLNEMIFLLFECNVEYIIMNGSDEGIINSNGLKIMKESLFELATLLLDILLKATKTNKMNVEQCQSDYETARKSIIEGLCKSSLYVKAIGLAEKHHDVPSLVFSIETSNYSIECIMEKHTQYIQIYGQDYFDTLIQYLDRKCLEKEKIILELLSKYPDYATNFLTENSLKLSWKFYLQQKDYKKALESIQVCMEQESDRDKLQEYTSWMTIFEAAIV